MPFWAVLTGKRTLVFTSWNLASKAIIGVKGVKHQKFDTDNPLVPHDWLLKEYQKKYPEPTEPVPPLEIDPELPEPEKQKLNTSKKRKLDEEAKDTVNNPVEEVVKNPLYHHGKDQKSEQVLFSDGGCRFQGTDRSRASWGVYNMWNPILSMHGLVPGPKQTNNRGELMGLMMAYLSVDLSVPGTWTICTDSQYAINACTVQLEHGLANIDLIVMLQCQVAEKKDRVVLKWVKGHDTSPGNIKADLLCNMALDEWEARS